MDNKNQPMDLWLEKIDAERHWQGFYEIWTDEQVAMWSTRKQATDEHTIRAEFHDLFVQTPSWVHAFGIMVRPANATQGPAIDAAEATLVGLIRFGSSTPGGPMVGYRIRSDSWGRGYATRALRQFLAWFWSETRRGPRGALFAPHHSVVIPAADGEAEASAMAVDPSEAAVATAGSVSESRDAETNHAVGAEKAAEAPAPEPKAEGDDEIEITFILAGVDPENIGSRRVIEKCGGVHVRTVKKGLKLWRFAEKRDVAIYRWDKPDTVS